MQRRNIILFEIIPPQKGRYSELYDNIDPLMEFKPPFIDVHFREEFIYVDKGNGLLDKTTRMRPGTLGICASIKQIR
jgi:methylenetetrahydrofolate reductase (NADPH)